MNRSDKRRNGWTIVEIMLVVTIIGILAVIATPKVHTIINNARCTRAQADLNVIAAAVRNLTADTGKWPATSNTPLSYTIIDAGTVINDEVLDLTTPDAGLLYCNTDRFGTRWRGSYLEKIPLDPWGMPYWLDPDYNVYSNRAAKTGLITNTIVVGSYGPNKGTLNSYDSDDIYIILK